ncbi:uncharacterized protein SPPG_01905 [Spizellomyces punctatus DAOM BR117]|uniref:Fcf2 pre-rRNA processing C-terminal domain-containing protein n=1 Tax=Spizellomyces punctatus (strain DAOM BR117) TaxID=645134 RepID=A0A0L0HPU2_SPIPD|nr:uncharacterized protein SPPG_01905 [Spizellomyces punctatus DAOM BR117]KND02824.1 hypothetical protein SPPG_01905 [Spizellomyces punctatus DAOM BR117]|eukprot:XP_016610863.1 hypothetical protein SPPG_01905 [Spizellomyces punctatus DAOM BR117]
MEHQDNNDMDLDELLAKATEVLKQQQAAMISLKSITEEKPSPLETVKLDPGVKSEELYIEDTNKYGAVRLQADRTVILKEEASGSKLSEKRKVQIGPEAINVQSAPETLPPALDWDKKKKKIMEKETAGPKWFDMPAPDMTEEIKRDLHILKSRAVIDPKRHYKKGTMKALPKFFQIGTIVQGPTEFFSSRLTRKERRDNIVDELLADNQAKSYYKRKFLEIQEQKNNFTRKGFKRRKDRK